MAGTAPRPLLLLTLLTALAGMAGCAGREEPPAPEPKASISIASFNLQIFGVTKAGKPDVLEAMAEIIRRFDLVAVQEIRDASGEAILRLAGIVNSAGARYDVRVGPRVGRSVSKEQYAFFYDTATLTPVAGCFTVDEGAADPFEREPFTCSFRARDGSFDFVVVNIHTRPDDATAEIQALPAVIESVALRSGDPDVILLGDLNADGDYFEEEGHASVFPADRYLWLIDNTVDTTVASSSRTYDRIILRSQTAEDFAGRTGVLGFSATPGDLSDHYPVWAEFWTDRDTE